MTDAEFIMRSEAKQHKANGRAVYNRASRGGSKRCRLPSDNLTKAQLKKMNGEIIVMQMNKPIAWSEFKRYSPELQREYIENLVAKYGARQLDIAEMFGIDKSHLNKYLSGIAPGIFASHRKKYIDPRWKAFIEGNIAEPQPIIEEAEPCIKEETIEAPKTKVPDSNSYNSTFVNTMHGNVSFKGDPYAIFAKAVKLFDEGKHYTITISFREENEDAEA